MQTQIEIIDFIFLGLNAVENLRANGFGGKAKNPSAHGKKQIKYLSLRKGEACWPRTDESLISGLGNARKRLLSPGERVGVRARVLPTELFRLSARVQEPEDTYLKTTDAVGSSW